MEQVDVQRSQEFRKCIECFLCQNVCHVIRDLPENIKITDNALIPMKERVVGRKYDPLVWLGNKITHRIPRDTPAVPVRKN